MLGSYLLHYWFGSVVLVKSPENRLLQFLAASGQAGVVEIVSVDGDQPISGPFDHLLASCAHALFVHGEA